MRKRFLTVLTLAAVCATLFLAPSRGLSQELVRERMRSDVGIELLGKGIFYSFYYQYMANKMLGLEAGLGVLGGGTAEDNVTVAVFPVGAKIYLIPKDGSLFLAGGATIVTAGVDSGPFDESTSFGYVGLGFEFRADNGFIFRGTAYGLLSSGGFFIWPGLTIGYAF